MIQALLSIVLAAALSWMGDGDAIHHPTKSAADKESISASTQPATTYPPAVQKALKQLRPTGGQTIVHADGKTYLVIGTGKRPTGGYRLSVERIKQTAADRYQVDIREHRPAAGAVTTQVITYPTIVVPLPHADAKVTVNMVQ